MGWPVESLVAKKACNLSLRPPPPSQLQLSNPLPNSPGAPTHLGQPHGQLSWSTLAQCKVLKYDLSSTLSAEKRLFRSFRQMQSLACLHQSFHNLLHNFPLVSTLHAAQLLHHSPLRRKWSHLEFVTQPQVQSTLFPNVLTSISKALCKSGTSNRGS